MMGAGTIYAKQYLDLIEEASIKLHNSVMANDYNAAMKHLKFLICIAVPELQQSLWSKFQAIENKRLALQKEIDSEILEDSAKKQVLTARITMELEPLLYEFLLTLYRGLHEKDAFTNPD